MKVFVSTLLILNLAVLAVWPENVIGGTERAQKEAEQTVYPFMKSFEEVCSVIAIPEEWTGRAYLSSYWVRLCTNTERGGGRQFTVESQNGSWAVVDECTWLESDLADPVRQVRVTAPVSVALARTIVGSLANKLRSEETVYIVRVHSDVVRDENGRMIGEPAEVDSLGEVVSFAKVQAAPVDNMYEVLTIHPSKPGRMAIVFAQGEYASIANWGFRLN
jgi:hypothetical protein